MQHSHEEDDCNVKLHWVPGADKGIKIPVFKNNKKILQGSPIVAFKSKTVQAVPLEEVEDPVQNTKAPKRASTTSAGSSKKLQKK